MFQGEKPLRTASLILLFSIRKQQENRMILPMNAARMHASAFLVPERPIAKILAVLLD
jgi:hypothetical protein